MHLDGEDSYLPELVILADKPDRFSSPVRISAIGNTTAGIYRSGPLEDFTASRSEDNSSILIEPLKPGKIFLTPNLHDRPGFSVSRVSIQILGDRQFRTMYQNDHDANKEWREWKPLEKL